MNQNKLMDYFDPLRIRIMIDVIHPFVTLLYVSASRKDWPSTPPFEIMILYVYLKFLNIVLCSLSNSVYIMLLTATLATTWKMMINIHHLFFYG